MANGTRWQQQTTSYNQSFEGTLQIARSFNQQLDVLAQRIEALRKEEARRYEIMMEEEARRHEQLLELIKSRFVQARDKEIAVQVPKEEKELEFTPIPLEKEVNSLTNSIIDQPAAVKEVEQKNLEILQIEDSNGHDVKPSDSASRPEGLLRLHATQPSPTKPIPNVETRNIEHSSSERSKLRDDIVPWHIRANQDKTKELTTEECKGLDNIGLTAAIKESDKHKQKRSVEMHQERSEDLKGQMLIQNSSQKKAYHVRSPISRLEQKIGTVIKRPHPSSLSLAFEQAKLKESDRELEVTLLTEGQCRAFTIVTPKWTQKVQNDIEEDSRVKAVVTELLVYAICKPNCATKHSNIAPKRNLKVASKSYGPLNVTKQTRPMARRLRLPEGSEEKLGKCGQPWEALQICARRQENRAGNSKGGLKEVTWKEKKRYLGSNWVLPNPVQEFHEFHP